MKKTKLQEEVSKKIVRSSLVHELRVFWGSYCEKNNVEDNRARENVIARHAFATACREFTPLPLKTIGKILHRDHASVLHAYRSHEVNIKFDSEYRAIFAYMEDKVRDFLIICGVKEKEGVSLTTVPDEVRQLRTKNINLLSKMRRMRKSHTDEKHEYEKKLEHYDAIQKHIKDLSKRNVALERELSRIKNLL